MFFDSQITHYLSTIFSSHKKFLRDWKIRIQKLEPQKPRIQPFSIQKYKEKKTFNEPPLPRF